MLFEAEAIIQLQGKLAGHASAAGILQDGLACVLGTSDFDAQMSIIKI
jgi:hypothetical protein